MTRRHSITPTDAGLLPPPGKDWKYSPPKVSADGKTVAIDATQLPMLIKHYERLGVPLVDSVVRRPGKK